MQDGTVDASQSKGNPFALTGPCGPCSPFPLVLRAMPEADTAAAMAYLMSLGV